ncbi:MAG: GNAT family N-acetyltransferase [Anaeromyxobacter sp.]
MIVTVRTADTRALRDAAMDLRIRVFVVEQKVPEELERDEHDAHAFHVIALDEAGRAVGTGRMYRQENPEGPVARVGRMAVDPAARRGRIGARLLEALEIEARRQGLPEVELHAQCHVEAFYAQAGYARAGDVFEEAGIAHVIMKKRL